MTLRSLSAASADRGVRRGATTAEIRNEYANAMKAYQQADEAIKSLEQFVRVRFAPFPHVTSR